MLKEIALFRFFSFFKFEDVLLFGVQLWHEGVAVLDVAVILPPTPRWWKA